MCQIDRKGLSAEQVAWARQHDWFVATMVVDGKHVVKVVDHGTRKFDSFADIRALRAWAGY